ncbi:MAG: metal-dependent transcriptional regulator, partial [Bacteroidota bacterium]
MNTHLENYLKSIYLIGLEGDGSVSTNSIAGRLDMKAPSVTDMLKKLDERGYVRHTPYQGTELTTKGRKLAIEVLRKHRLWEMFLVDKLGFTWDEVHEVAEQLE